VDGLLHSVNNARDFSDKEKVRAIELYCCRYTVDNPAAEPVFTGLFHEF